VTAGAHILTVESHSHNDGGSGMRLICSCGFEESLDGNCQFGAGGPASGALASLDYLNEIAGRHRAEART
jgi:hypothetical protein